MRTTPLWAAAIAAVPVTGPALPQTQADKSFEETYRQQQEQQKAEIAAKSPPGEPFKWVQNVTNLDAGGWKLAGEYDDGKQSMYVTPRDAMRQGNIATV
jgi:hypothetical protein